MFGSYFPRGFLGPVFRGQVRESDLEINFLMNLLTGFSINDREDGSQGLVTLKHICEGMFQSTVVQFPSHVESCRDVIGDIRTVCSVKLPQYPQSPLCVGERIVIRIRNLFNGSIRGDLF